MKLIKLFSLVLLIVGFSSVLAEETEHEKLLAVQKINILDRPLLMVGMGLTRSISDDYYIGAFYLDEAVSFSDDEDLVYVDSARRMEFRFASEHKISARGFARKIAEGIRINNTKKEITAENSKLKQFMQLFKGSYNKGDVIRFDYHASFGTRISYNDKTLGTIRNSKEFYRLLVKLWMGERPPSSVFKQGIIGKNDNAYSIELLKRFVSL